MNSYGTMLTIESELLLKWVHKMAYTTKLILRALKTILELCMANNRLLVDMHRVTCPKIDNPIDPKYHDLRTDGFYTAFYIKQYIEEGIENE